MQINAIVGRRSRPGGIWGRLEAYFPDEMLNVLYCIYMSLISIQH